MFLEAIASRRLELAMASGGKAPQKAEIWTLNSSYPGKKYREVSFNPESIKFKTKACWKDITDPNGTDGHHSVFSGTMANELKMELLFDTTMTGDSVYDKYIKFLADLLVPVKLPGSNIMQPPRCMFVWGKFSKPPYHMFHAILEELDVEYTWFLADGKPVRAEVDVTFKKPDEDKKKQNPTSVSEARRVWRVVEGQTLDWIAYTEYGDSAAWRHIAQVNNLQNPRDLRPGTVLKLTPLP